MLGLSGEGRPAHWDLLAPQINLNVAQQTLAAPAFNFSYSGAQLTGSAQATKILDDLTPRRLGDLGALAAAGN